MLSQFLILFFRLQWVLLLLLPLFLSNSATASEEVIEYTVQQNDNLSTVLQKLSLKPIYGKNGSLAEVLRLNPEKQESKGNCIYVGEVILLPKSMLHNPIEQAKEPTKNLKITEKIVKPIPQKQVEAKKIEQKLIAPAIAKKSEEKIIAPPKVQQNQVPPPKHDTASQIDKQLPVKNNQVNSITKENNIFQQNNTPVTSSVANNNTVSIIKTPETYSTTGTKAQESLQTTSQQKQFSINMTDIFLSRSEKTTNKQLTSKNFDLDNKSKVEAGFFSGSKTILLALPLRSQAEKRTDILSQTTTKQISSELPVMNIESFLEEENCDAFRSCKLRLWDLNNKCCKPQKTYFIFYEKNSL